MMAMADRTRGDIKKHLRVALLFLFVVFASETGVHAAYSIHVASFQDLNQAQADVERLKALGFDAFFEEADVKGRGKWFRVYVGRYESKSKASTAAGILKNKKLIDKTFIHHLPGGQTALKSLNNRMVSKKQTKESQVSPSRVSGPVHGNMDTKRYHLPGMPYYNKVKKHHLIVFQSEREAIEKGYYKAGTIPKIEKKEDKPTADSVKQQTILSKDVKNSEPENKKEAVSQDELKNRQTRLEKPVLASVAEQLKKAREKLSIKDKKGQSQDQDQKSSSVLYTPPPMEDPGKEKEEEFTEPDITDFVEPVSDSPLYNKAIDELKRRKYEQALITFKEYISRDDTPKEWGQRALRHMADAHYALGKAGRREELLMASEFYKNTLESFPDPRPENALTYYRLAKTYESLKYYPDAIRQYQNLIRKYPGSPWVAEAHYKIGELYYIDGKYAQAQESLLQYLLKFRGKANTRKSYYMVAHSYYKDKQSGNAEIWFRDARKKWSTFMGVPRDILIDLVHHKMSLRQHDEAISVLSFYANIYPKDEKIKQVLGLLAQAYEQNGRWASALAVYSRIIEKYPDSKEATESMLRMADLGIDKPGLKVFRAMNGIDRYRYPMDTYDDIIMKHAADDLAQQAMLHKAAALVKKDQKRKAADVYLEFISLFPDSKRIDDAARGLKSAASAIIDEYFAKKDYLAVAYVYFRSFGALPVSAEEYPQIQKIATSLKELNLIEDYTAVLQKYLASARNEQIIDKVSVDIAEGLILQGQYDQAEKILQSLLGKPAVKKSGMMTAIRKHLADIAYKREQYAQAVANYGDVIKSGQELQNPAKIYTRYAHSLKEQKENSLALQNYLSAVKYLSSENRNKENLGLTYNEIGDLYVKGDNLGLGVSMYNKALENTTNPEMKLWLKFMLGHTYLKLSKEEKAEDLFAQIKTTAGPESFWSKVVDFYARDSKWWDKYGGMIQK
jgi:tetratricopeptide (TPR) repeat protein